MYIHGDNHPRYTVGVLVDNEPGVLSRVSGLFFRRGFNIDSLAVGPTQDPEVSRITLVVIAVIAIIIAWDSNSTIFGITSFAWAGFGAAFGPLMLFSLFWKRVNKAGAIAGMVSGAGMVFLWKLVISKLGGVFAIYELLPAFLISSIVIVVVSQCTKAPEAEIVEEFESIGK